MRALVTWLQGQSAAGPIGILGHSEGGWSGPIAAAGNDEIEFLVLLAGPGLGGRELLADQSRAVLRANGISDSIIDWHARFATPTFDVIASEESNEEILRDQIMEIYRTLLAEMDPQEKAQLFTAWSISPGADWEAQVEESLAIQLTPWFRDLMRHEAAPILRRLDQPILALFGEKDIQVTAEANAEAVRSALVSNKNASVEILPGLNHLFQEAESGMVEEYAALEQTIAPVVLDRVRAWILELYPPAETNTKGAQ